MKKKFIVLAALFVLGTTTVVASQFTKEGLADQQEHVTAVGALGRWFNAQNF